MKKSKCFQKYGKEWSKELTRTTRNYFEYIFAGYVKHIGGKGFRYAIDRVILKMNGYTSLIPEDEMNKKIFLFTLSESDTLGHRDMTFDVAYDSADDLVDDGWAID